MSRFSSTARSTGIFTHADETNYLAGYLAGWAMGRQEAKKAPVFGSQLDLFREEGQKLVPALSVIPSNTVPFDESREFKTAPAPTTIVTQQEVENNSPETETDKEDDAFWFNLLTRAERKAVVTVILVALMIVLAVVGQ
jgi:hypothetical protein